MAIIPDISVSKSASSKTTRRPGRRSSHPSFKKDGRSSSRTRVAPPCPNKAPAIFYDRERCPTRNTLAPLLNSWTFLVLTHLSFETHRYTELRGAIPDISDRMLTKTLSTLVAKGIVNKERHSGMPPRVDYSLTDVGQDLLPAIEPLLHWALRNTSEK